MLVTDSYLTQLQAATQRYAQGTGARENTRRILDAKGVLHADEPDRVEKRLQRLKTSWTLARALEQTPRDRTTGRSLGRAISPETFGADVLGLERLMGRNDLIDVGFLERGYLAARSIGRITVRAAGGGYGTGFLISPTLLMTNNHVLRDTTDAADAYVEFNYQSGLDGMPLTPVAFSLDPKRLFVTDAELDFSVVAVQPQSSTGTALTAFGHLQLIEQEGKVILGEFVNVIQHPNGEPKQLALRENEVVDILDLFVHYDTDTAPGSSGSPVCNDQWEVVALHHMGVPKTDELGEYLAVDGSRWTPDQGEERLAWKANEGARISRVARALRNQRLSGDAGEMLAQVFEATDAFADANVGVSSPLPRPSAELAPGPGGRWTPPLKITVTIEPQALTHPISPNLGGPAPAASDEIPPPADTSGLRAALVALEANRSRPYYSKRADEAARDSYYEGLEASGDPAALLRALSEQLEQTHRPRVRYKPMDLVYPWGSTSIPTGSCAPSTPASRSRRRPSSGRTRGPRRRARREWSS